MTIEIIKCPHCRAQVVPMGDGTCPACRKNTRDAPRSVLTRDTAATRESEGDKYQKSLRSTTIEPLIAPLRQIEQQFTDLRTGAVASLRANAGADRAAADRIQEELLPQYVAAVERLRQEGEAYAQKSGDMSHLIQYAKTRAESWQLLVEALRENDAEKLQRHIELWANSEMFVVSGVAAGGESMATPTPAQRVRDFQRSLVTFTPRLIATPTLVIANILVFAAMTATGVHFFAPTVQDIANWGANFGPKTMNGQWWRLVTCMFLHYGILHLGFNMWVLWSLGRLVERLVGNVGFVLLYVVAGIAGSIASLAWDPTVVSAGASGAVFGVAGALLGLVAFRRDTVPAPVLKQLRNSMAGFLIYNVFYAMTTSGIDMAAHIGGLVAGSACGFILSQPLSIEMIARRGVRNGAVAVTGAIALSLAAFALPDAPPDIEREIQRFAEMEKRVLDISNAVIGRAQRGVLSDADFAETLERDVLPPWIEARGRLERLVDAPYANQAYLSRLVKYMTRREESWHLQVEGLREHDPTKLEQANDRWAAAEEMVKELAAP